ncbi:MAG: adenine-specific methyltransferase EcoRI family protein [Paludibacteraceae bacterium]|nr:adenine-specific methyltransferase EcoRI family protein [Paludibacteraceae bacterium]
MPPGNNALHAANRARQDEFYTQLSDIEKELRHYTEHFRGKVVFCNCDDPYESNFFKYFAMNFNHLGLKRLIATCYNGSPVQGNELLLQFDSDNPEEPKKIAYKIEISEVHDANGDGAIDLADVRYLLQNDKNVISILKGNGDFRSPECVELLKQADIVVTNPPFSLFREYVAQLVKYEKQFLIIGNQNAITYKEIFKLIKENKIWLGSSLSYIAFKVPNYYEERATRFWIDDTGQKWRSLGNVCWFTNLDVQKRHEDLILYKSYNPEEYPKYDNYDAINVNKTAEIPCDYNEAMGVPITFLDKYNPEQFEIIGAMTTTKVDEYNYGYPYVNGVKIYARILIKKKK